MKLPEVLQVSLSSYISPNTLAEGGARGGAVG